MADKKDFIDQAEFLDKEELKEELSEFRKFALKKNMLELAVAFILGASFQKLVSGISESLFMPIINAILSHTGSAWKEAVWSVGGASIEIGKLGGLAVDFLVTAIILYILYVKIFKKMWGVEKKEASKSKVPISIGS